MDASVLVFPWGSPAYWCPCGLLCPLGFPNQLVQVGWCRATSGSDAAVAVPILIFLPLAPRLAITQEAPLGATSGDRWVLTAACIALPAGSSAMAAARGSSTVPGRKPAEGRAGPCSSENAGGDTDSHDYAAESGVSRSPGETCTCACSCMLVHTCECFCVFGRRGLGVHKAGSCTRVVSAQRAALVGAEGFHIAEHQRLLVYAAGWGLVLGGSGVLVGPGGVAEGDLHSLPCVWGGEAGPSCAFPGKGAAYDLWKDVNLKSFM